MLLTLNGVEVYSCSVTYLYYRHPRVRLSSDTVVSPTRGGAMVRVTLVDPAPAAAGAALSDGAFPVECAGWARVVYGGVTVVLRRANASVAEFSTVAAPTGATSAVVSLNGVDMEPALFVAAYAPAVIAAVSPTLIPDSGRSLLTVTGSWYSTGYAWGRLSGPPVATSCAGLASYWCCAMISGTLIQCAVPPFAARVLPDGPAVFNVTVDPPHVSEPAFSSLPMFVHVTAPTFAAVSPSGVPVGATVPLVVWFDAMALGGSSSAALAAAGAAAPCVAVGDPPDGSDPRGGWCVPLARRAVLLAVVAVTTAGSNGVVLGLSVGAYHVPLSVPSTLLRSLDASGRDFCAQRYIRVFDGSNPTTEIPAWFDPATCGAAAAGAIATVWAAVPIPMNAAASEGAAWNAKVLLSTLSLGEMNSAAASEQQGRRPVLWRGVTVFPLFFDCGDSSDQHDWTILDPSGATYAARVVISAAGLSTQRILLVLSRSGVASPPAALPRALRAGGALHMEWNFTRGRDDGVSKYILITARSFVAFGPAVATGGMICLDAAVAVVATYSGVDGGVQFSLVGGTCATVPVLQCPGSAAPEPKRLVPSDITISPTGVLVEACGKTVFLSTSTLGMNLRVYVGIVGPPGTTLAQPLRDVYARLFVRHAPLPQVVSSPPAVSSIWRMVPAAGAPLDGVAVASMRAVRVLFNGQVLAATVPTWYGQFTAPLGFIASFAAPSLSGVSPPVIDVSAPPAITFSGALIQNISGLHAAITDARGSVIVCPCLAASTVLLRCAAAAGLPTLRYRLVPGALTLALAYGQLSAFSTPPGPPLVAVDVADAGTLALSPLLCSSNPSVPCRVSVDVTRVSGATAGAVSSWLADHMGLCAAPAPALIGDGTCTQGVAAAAGVVDFVITPRGSSMFFAVRLGGPGVPLAGLPPATLVSTFDFSAIVFSIAPSAGPTPSVVAHSSVRFTTPGCFPLASTPLIAWTGDASGRTVWGGGVVSDAVPLWPSAAVLPAGAFDPVCDASVSYVVLQTFLSADDLTGQSGAAATVRGVKYRFSSPPAPGFVVVGMQVRVVLLDAPPASLQQPDGSPAALLTSGGFGPPSVLDVVPAAVIEGAEDGWLTLLLAAPVLVASGKVLGVELSRWSSVGDATVPFTCSFDMLEVQSPVTLVSVARGSGSAPVTTVAARAPRMQALLGCAAIVAAVPTELSLGAELSRVLSVRLSLDAGRNVVPGAVAFTLYSARVSVTSVQPSRGPVSGGSEVEVGGQQFPDTPAGVYLRWRFPRAQPARVVHVFTPATFVVIAQRRLVRAVTPAALGRMTGAGVLLTVTVDVSFNAGHDYSSFGSGGAGAKFTFYAAPRIVSVSPAALPAFGHVAVSFVAANIIFDARTLLCRFGAPGDDAMRVVPAQFPTGLPPFVALGSFTCAAPSHPAGDVTVSFTNNGVDYATPGDDARLAFQPCRPGWVAPNYFAPCAMCGPGTYAANTTCAACAPTGCVRGTHVDSSVWAPPFIRHVCAHCAPHCVT